MCAVRLTAKEDKFCIEHVNGLNASDAYRSAYNTAKMKIETINVKASLLLKKDKIRARIAELKAPVIEKAQLTLETHLERLDHLSRAAEAAEQYGAAITAETNRGKAAGLYITKVETNTDTPLTVEIVRFGKD